MQPPPSPLRLLLSLTLVGVLLIAPALPARAQDDAAARQLYPLAKPRPAPEVVIDVSEAPEAKAWGENAKRLVEQWFPIVCQFLATEEYTPPKRLTLVFKKEQGPPAFATGTGGEAATISINNRWITAHPDDFGMVIHEMTHVIQGYSRRGEKPGWLVEGIADYIRFWRYEPDPARRPINREKASYRDSYRTTAAFLAWVGARYDRRLVYRLDQAMRAGTYNADLWKTITGKDVDTLWAEFAATLPGPPMPAPAKS